MTDVTLTIRRSGALDGRCIPSIVLVHAKDRSEGGYFIQAMDIMYDHLRHGRPLPPSQVVHTIPRGLGAPLLPISPANVPPIADTPPPGSQITFTDGQVKIPN